MTFKPIYIIILFSVLLSSSYRLLNGGVLTVQIDGIKNNNGMLLLALYNKKEAFPQESNLAYTKRLLKISNQKAYVQLNDLPPGWYAIAVFHDENNNRAMDKNMVGIPKEGYGISNNAHQKFGPPSWESAKLKVENENYTALIKLKY
jgi:uncharacterized protein (DUF2141 family)